MKKILAAGILALALIGCDHKAQVGAKVFPPVLNHIQVYNGGALVFEASNVSIEVQRITNAKLIGSSEHWTQYNLSYDGKIVHIVDSEALAIIWE